jgi:hypothetical protein
LTAVIVDFMKQLPLSGRPAHTSFSDAGHTSLLGGLLLLLRPARR